MPILKVLQIWEVTDKIENTAGQAIHGERKTHGISSVILNIYAIQMQAHQRETIIHSLPQQMLSVFSIF